MKIKELLFDTRIKDNTIIVIRDVTDELITVGYWFCDEILSWGSFSATFKYLEDENVAVFQLI